MGAAEHKNKNSAMAGYLKAHGFPHGKTATSTHAPPVPSMRDVGSAAYRRRVAKS